MINLNVLKMTNTQRRLITGIRKRQWAVRVDKFCLNILKVLFIWKRQCDLWSLFETWSTGRYCNSWKYITNLQGKTTRKDSLTGLHQNTPGFENVRTRIYTLWSRSRHVKNHTIPVGTALDNDDLHIQEDRTRSQFHSLKTFAISLNRRPVDAESTSLNK